MSFDIVQGVKMLERMVFGLSTKKHAQGGMLSIWIRQVIDYTLQSALIQYCKPRIFLDSNIEPANVNCVLHIVVLRSYQVVSILAWGSMEAGYLNKGMFLYFIICFTSWVMKVARFMAL